jgi:hypothetical protein
MANYRPKAVTVEASLADSGTAYTKDISKSGAVQVWESTAPTTGEAQHTTFTDAVGRYGVTCKANVALVIKFFGV